MTKRILVAEDQVDNRQIVRDLLAANDYEMTEAETARRHLRLWRKNGQTRSSPCRAIGR